jgi:hypothetical protein
MKTRKVSMANTKKLRQAVDEKLKEHFYQLKEKFDAMADKAGELTVETQKDIEEAKKNANKPLDSKEYSKELRSLMKSDTDDRNAGLMEEVNVVLSHFTQKEQNTSYIWFGILAIFILQIITFIK